MNGIFRVDRFKAMADRIGLARGHLFNLQITFPSFLESNPLSSIFQLWHSDADNVLWCRAATPPTSIIETTEIFVHGRAVKLPGRRTFPPFTTTFFLTKSYHTRQMFQAWVDSLNSPSENVQTERVYAEITLTHYDVEALANPNVNSVTSSVLQHFHKPMAVYKMVNAFPVSVGAPTLAYDQEDISAFDVEWNYQHMTTELSPRTSSTWRPGPIIGNPLSGSSNV